MQMPLSPNQCRHAQVMEDPDCVYSPPKREGRPRSTCMLGSRSGTLAGGGSGQRAVGKSLGLTFSIQKAVAAVRTGRYTVGPQAAA